MPEKSKEKTFATRQTDYKDKKEEVFAKAHKEHQASKKEESKKQAK